MRKPIPITGISTSSAYPDGNCISLVNLRKKNGVFKPVTPRKIVNTLGFAYDELFVHQLPNTGENWLGIRGGHLYWIENVTTTKTEHDLCTVTTDKLPQITQIGNLLNVLDSNGLQYLIWNENDYKLINTNFDGAQTDTVLGPVKVDIRVTDSLQNPRVYRGVTERKYTSSIEAEADMDNVAVEIDGLIEKALSIERDKGYMNGFCLACTAIELYDGSYILHSQPFFIGQSLDSETRYSYSFNNSIKNYINRDMVFYNGGAFGLNAQNWMGGLFTVDDNNSFELSGGIGISNDGIKYFSGNFESFGNGVVKSFGDEVVKSFGDGGSEYWDSELIDEPNPNYPNFAEKFYDIPEGTKFNVSVNYGEGGVLFYLITRKAKRFDIVHPNLVGYLDKFTNNVSQQYACVIIRNSKLEIKINNSIASEYRSLIKSIGVFITNEISFYKNDDTTKKIKTKRLTSVKPANTSFYAIDNYFPDIKTDAEILKELSANQQFYKVKEIAFDDINTNVGTWIDLTEDLKGKLGDNLTMQEELPVDNFTHHILIPQKQMVYNSKLHVMDYKTILSRGWPLPYFQPETGIGQFPAYGYSTSLSTEFLYYIEISIKTDTGITKVVRYSTTNIGFSDLSCMLSYPDSRATNMVIYQWTKTTIGAQKMSKKLSVKLTPSESQNFAYYITPDLKPISFLLLPIDEKDTIPTEIQRKLVYRNQMKVSAVNNPFYFPAITTYTIGTGFILNAGTNAVRMSEGQFGQYDLYVFTSEGIYSLDTGTTLSYNRISPASLELPISDIICSTPFGVIFIGKRGLFIINGQQVDYLTPQLEQEPLTIALNMPSSTNVPNIVSIKTWNDWFKDYLTDVTEIVYDNQNNEIIIINPTKEYNFVYNLDSKEFYQQTEVINKVVQGVYPELLVTEGMNIKDFGQNQMTNDVIPVSVKAKVSFITRPFNFGTPDVKKLERLILRARLIGAEDMVVMNHASNDGINFVPVQGQSFPTIGNYKDIDLGLMARNKHRQFIFAMSAKLNEQSEIQLLEAEVSSEYMNEKMR
jgi:hypothetical protein